MLNTPESGVIIAPFVVAHVLRFRLVSGIERSPNQMATIYPSLSTSDNPFAAPAEDAFSRMDNPSLFIANHP